MRQNNPLLYIFIGVPETAMERVREIQSRRVDTSGVGYLHVAEYDRERLLAEIRAVQSRFLTKSYVTAGELKVVYVTDADSPAAGRLAQIKHDMEAYLQFQYPGGIVSDLFLLLDDVAEVPRDGWRGQVLDMLSELHSDTCMLYMLSNVNSKKLYEPSAYERMLHSVALLGIMKDYISLQSDEQVYRWYNERYFKEDCYLRGGQFLTVGYLSIRRPIELIQKLLLIELLTYRRIVVEPECRFNWSVQIVSDDSWARLRENIHGLAINAAFDMNTLDRYSHAQAIEQLYGRRLDLFFEINLQAEHVSDGSAQVRRFIQESARDPGKGFYYIHAVTSPDGPLKRMLRDRLAETQRALTALDSHAAGWGSMRCVPSRRLLNAARMPEYVYELAVAYLTPRFERLQPELEITRLQAAIEYVDSCHQELSQHYEILEKFIADCRTEADAFRTTEDLFFRSSNLNDYYLEIQRTFIQTDSRFDAIYARMWRSFEKFPIYIAELESYIQNVILQLPAFRQGVVSDLTELYGGESGLAFYERIWEFILENRYFHILLKSGDKTLYSEINMFLDASGQMARKISVLAAREKINFFYEDNGDTIDVLYHGGAFSLTDLYYEALYRGQGL